MSAVLPWQAAQWQQLQARLKAGNLPHGLLLLGQEGLGKAAFARALAKVALCEHPSTDGVACGQCQACVLFEAGTHPDFAQVSPEEDSKQIKVDQIREFIGFMALSRQYDRYKVAIIAPAEAMNVNAANSLLKTLEEPAAYSLLILVTCQPSRLPATIRSRCQQLKFSAPPREVALGWLKAQGIEHETELLLSQAHGAPLAALAYAEDEALAARKDFFSALQGLVQGKSGAVGLAQTWKETDLGLLLRWQLSWLQDMIRYRLSENPVASDNPDLAQDLRRLAESVDLKSLFALQDALLRFRAMLSTPVNPQQSVLKRKQTFQVYRLCQPTQVLGQIRVIGCDGVLTEPVANHVLQPGELPAQQQPEIGLFPGLRDAHGTRFALDQPLQGGKKVLTRRQCLVLCKGQGRQRRAVGLTEE